MAFVILNLILFTGVCVVLRTLAKREASLSRRVFTALIVGAVGGSLVQVIFGHDSVVVMNTLEWTNAVGSGYVALLKMIIMPLVLISMLAAVVEMDRISSLGKYGGAILFVLIGTTAIAAIVGIGVANMFGLSADGLTQGARELARVDVLAERQGVVSELSLPAILVSFIPENIFADLAGSRKTSIIAVVIFGVLLGIAGLKLVAEEPEQGQRFRSFVKSAQALIMRLVKMIIEFTPYGVLALMFKVGASSSLADILDLIKFIVASYVAILIMFLVHGGLLLVNGLYPKVYFQKVLPVLSFAFSSRSSAATIPLNVETQTQQLKVKPVIANLSASLGATIGQNGCAGIYPAMLAVMIAPSVGIDPSQPMFILSLVGIIIVSSFGVAGVGGGATFAALIVLPAMGLPVALAALLISIEPMIDMARTALNLNGSKTAGVITDRRTASQETGDEQPQQV